MRMYRKDHSNSGTGIKDKSLACFDDFLFIGSVPAGMLGVWLGVLQA